MYTEMNIDIVKLLDYTEEVLNTEAEMKLHRRTLPALVWIPDLDGSAAYREGELDARSSEAWNGLATVCHILGLEEKELIAVAKSIRRWQIHGGKYDRLVYYKPGTEDRIARYLKRDSYMASHYRSTYREIK